MQHQITIIENAINEILDEGKELIEITERFNILLRDLNNGYPELSRKKVDLINNLLKYPKKKILFEFDYTSSGGHLEKFVVGLNESGLGLRGNWGSNMRNINNYWERENFIKLLKNEEFRKLLLKNVNKKHKAIIEKAVIDNTKEYTKQISIGKLEVFITQYSIQYYIDDESIDIITPKEKSDYNISTLIEFGKLLLNKEQIVNTLNKEIKNFEALKTELESKTAEIDSELKPFLALKQI